MCRGARADFCPLDASILMITVLEMPMLPCVYIVGYSLRVTACGQGSALCCTSKMGVKPGMHGTKRRVVFNLHRRSGVLDKGQGVAFACKPFITHKPRPSSCLRLQPSGAASRRALEAHFTKACRNRGLTR